MYQGGHDVKYYFIYVGHVRRFWVDRHDCIVKSFCLNLGTNVVNAKKEDAGKILTDTLRKLLDELKVPNGLTALGYKTECVPTMVAGAMPQVYFMSNISVLFLLQIYKISLKSHYVLYYHHYYWLIAKTMY